MNETYAADERAELEALQRQMGLDGGQAGAPGGRAQQPAGGERIPIPQYDPPPDPFAAAGYDQQQPAPYRGPQFGQAGAPGGIPPAAVVEERRRRQEAERENGEIREALRRNEENQAALKERLAMLGEVVARGQQQELAGNRQIPTFDEDPAGHIQAVNELSARQANERLAAIEKQQREILENQRRHDQVIDEETQDRAVANAVARQAADFVRQQPDFRQAYEFMIGSRKAELLAQGYNAEEVAEYVDNEEKMLARSHLARGNSVPEAFYRAAMARGYQPGRGAPRGDQGGQAAPQYRQPAALPAPDYRQQQQYQAPAWQQPQQYQEPAYNPAAYYTGQPSLDNMQAGMMAGGHLADTAGGGHGGGFPSIEQLGAMDEEQLMASVPLINAHIEGLRRAGH